MPLVSAKQVSYVPKDPKSWYERQPTLVSQALDILAARTLYTYEIVGVGDGIRTHFSVPVPHFWSTGQGLVFAKVNGNVVPFTESSINPNGTQPANLPTAATIARRSFGVIFNTPPVLGQTVTLRWQQRVLLWPDIWPAPVYLSLNAQGLYEPDLAVVWRTRRGAQPPFLPGQVSTNGVSLPGLADGYSYEVWRRTRRSGGLDKLNPHRYGLRYYLYRIEPAAGTTSPFIYFQSDLSPSSTNRTRFFRVCVYRAYDGARSPLSNAVILVNGRTLQVTAR